MSPTPYCLHSLHHCEPTGFPTYQTVNRRHGIISGVTQLKLLKSQSLFAVFLYTQLCIVIFMAGILYAQGTYAFKHSSFNC